jgi:hypothetical protein
MSVADWITVGVVGIVAGPLLLLALAWWLKTCWEVFVAIFGKD